MKLGILAAAGFFLASISDSGACNRTISPGADLQASVNAAGTVICLNIGTYRIATTLTIPAGKTIRGLGSSRENVVIESSIDSGGSMVRPGAGTTIQNLTIISAPSKLPTYGVLVYATADVRLWSVHVKKSKINVGLVYATRAKLLDTYLSMPGNPDDGAANPNLWVFQSDDVNVWYGAVWGGGGVGTDSGGALVGDGEIGFYKSTNVGITGTAFFSSGTSAIYFRNCDNCFIKSANVYNAKGFGLDLVADIDDPNNGNNNLVVENTSVYNSGYGGAVIRMADSKFVRFAYNNFQNNNRTGHSNCTGINVGGSPANLQLIGNTVSPGPISCIR